MASRAPLIMGDSVNLLSGERAATSLIRPIVAHDLLARYPEVHDGLERLAMVYAARGDRARAAEYYRKAGDFVHAHADQYGPNMESYFWKRVAEFEAPQE